MAKPLTPEKFAKLAAKLKELTTPGPAYDMPFPPDANVRVRELFRHHPRDVRIEAQRCFDILMAKHRWKFTGMSKKQKVSYKGILVATATRIAKVNLGLAMPMADRSRISMGRKRRASSIKTQLGLQRGLMEFPGATLTEKWKARKAASQLEVENEHNYNGDPAPRLRVKEGEYA